MSLIRAWEKNYQHQRIIAANKHINTQTRCSNPSVPRRKALHLHRRRLRCRQRRGRNRMEAPGRAFRKSLGFHSCSDFRSRRSARGQRKSFRARSFGEYKDDENRESKLQRLFSQTQGDATCFGFTICSCVGQKTSTTLVDDDEKNDEEKPLFECELWLSRGRESEESGPPGSWNVVCKDASDVTTLLCLC